MKRGKGIENLYSVRFNGSTLAVCKYEVIAEHPGGLLGINNITPGLNKLPTHVSESIHQSCLGIVREQSNAYIVYVDSIEKISDAVAAIQDRVYADKEAYLQAVAQRTSEFEMQLGTIKSVDIASLTERLDAE